MCPAAIGIITMAGHLPEVVPATKPGSIGADDDGTDRVIPCGLIQRRLQRGEHGL